MPNPRFLQTAKKWMNKEIPAERPKQSKEQPRLTQILERDSEGKPKLTLSPLEETAIHTPTQGEYNTLMQVYECGGWKWNGGELPIQDSDAWNTHKEKTCIFAKNEFKYSSEEYNRTRGNQIISTQEFYNAQNPPITPEMIDEINQWFEKNGK